MNELANVTATEESEIYQLTCLKNALKSVEEVLKKSQNELKHCNYGNADGWMNSAICFMDRANHHLRIVGEIKRKRRAQQRAEARAVAAKTK